MAIIGNFMTHACRNFALLLGFVCAVGQAQSPQQLQLQVGQVRVPGAEIKDIRMDIQFPMAESLDLSLTAMVAVDTLARILPLQVDAQGCAWQSPAWQCASARLSLGSFVLHAKEFSLSELGGEWQLKMAHGEVISQPEAPISLQANITLNAKLDENIHIELVVSELGFDTPSGSYAAMGVQAELEWDQLDTRWALNSTWSGGEVLLGDWYFSLNDAPAVQVEFAGEESMGQAVIHQQDRVTLQSDFKLAEEGLEIRSLTGNAALDAVVQQFASYWLSTQGFESLTVNSGQVKASLQGDPRSLWDVIAGNSETSYDFEISVEDVRPGRCRPEHPCGWAFRILQAQ